MKISSVALDITNSDIRVVSMENGKVTTWQSEPLPEGLVRGGTINEPRAVSVIIDNLFKAQNLSKNRVACCVTGLPFIYRTINMPGLGREVTGEALERAAKKEMSLSDEDMVLAWQSLTEYPDKKETDYFIVGVPKISLSPLLETLSLAKISPISIDLKPLALARAASAGTALIVSLEKNYFDIILVGNNQIRVIHSLSPSTGLEDTSTVVSELVDGLNKAVKSFYREFPQDSLPPETPILLSGELSSDENLLTQVTEATGHPTSILQCKIELPPELTSRLFGANIGLIMKNLPSSETVPSQYRDININLLLSLRKKPKQKFRTAYAVTALIVVVLAAGVYYTFSLKSDADARVASLQQQGTAITKTLSDAQKANKESLAAKESNLVQIQTINDQISELKNTKGRITGQQRDYAFRMTYVLGKFPAESEYKTLNMDMQTIQATGRINNPIDAVIFSENVAQNDIFTNARVVDIVPVSQSTKADFTVLITE
jgi:hypothetical protein